MVPAVSCKITSLLQTIKHKLLRLLNHSVLFTKVETKSTIISIALPYPFSINENQVKNHIQEWQQCNVKVGYFVGQVTKLSITRLHRFEWQDDRQIRMNMDAAMV